MSERFIQGTVVLLALAAAAAGSVFADEQKTEATAVYRGSSRAVKFDVSPPLRSIRAIPVAKPPGNIVEREPGVLGPLGPQSVDPVVQGSVSRGEIPAPSASFDGPPNVAGYSPPDPVGDVGPDHYVAMSNVHFGIYDKTGTLLYGPAANNTLWTDFGGDCETDNSGDPIVLYDQLADRWILTQFTASGPDFYNCVAVSQTPDPTGAYYRYAFSTGSNFPDYPKYGVWPDAYYISTREFDGLYGPFLGVGAWALNRADMVAGNPSPQVISFFATAASAGGAYNLGDGLLPADLDGFNPPPAGSPNYFVGSMDDGAGYSAPADALTVWEFDVDFATPANSSFSLAATIPIAPYDTQFSPCSGRSCIPQPGTTNELDILSYRQRPMHRLAYRNYGSHEAMVTNQSVEAPGGIAGMRWWEVRDPGGTPTVYQEGTFAPGVTDGIHRWMGSIAMDEAGNMALGYSASDGASTYPSVWYAGRLAGDPLGELAQGEGSFMDGAGSQNGTSQRWGDYTSMNIDPNDDCTFWYINEYYPTSSSTGWQLRVGSFKFDECGSPDFYLGAAPSSQDICAGADAMFDISIGSVSSFNNPVTLAATGNPAGTTASFVPNPATPPGASVLTIGNTGALSYGAVTASVNGTATGSPGHSIDVGLNVFDMTPAASTLTLPADGALNQPLKPTFEWTAVIQTASYTLEVDDDPTFASPELVVAGITDTTFTPDSDMMSNTVFHWRVSADNACGMGPASAAFTMTTVALPGDCGLGTIPVIAFTEDFESGAALWTHDGTADTWALSSTNVHGGAFAYSASTPTSSDQRLMTPAIALPNETPLTIQFWNWQEIEDRSGGCFDGGVLEISTDAGATWAQLPTGLMQTDPYDGPISDCCGNVLENEDAWCGDPQDWLRSVVDLGAYAGETAMFRFRYASDTSVGHTGWVIDDVAVQACVPESSFPLFKDGFEIGDTSAWGTTVQ